MLITPVVGLWELKLRCEVKISQSHRAGARLMWSVCTQPPAAQ